VEEHDESQEYPRELMQRAAELGFLGVIFPEELGGAGLGYVEYVLVVTELSKVDPSVGISVAAHNSLCTNHIYKFGNDEQRRRWVPRLATGEWIGAWALTEAGSGSDAAAARTTAKKVDGGWVLDGSKAFCTHGAVGDVVVVMAVTDPTGRKGRNMSAFVVERGASGLRAGKKENKLGIRASDTSEVVLEGCFVPDDQLLGQPGDGFRQALQVLDGGRISIAALGLARRRAPTRPRSPTPRSGTSSTSRSRSSRRSASHWPRWRRASPPPRRSRWRRRSRWTRPAR
jgi:alkylation response protein AidB-like acyl-CoA dehydrogenase